MEEACVQNKNSSGFEERKPLISSAVLELLRNEGLTDDQAMVIIIFLGSYVPSNTALTVGSIIS